MVEIDRSRSEVTIVRLNRPERLNALTLEVVADLHQVFDDVASDSACRVVILTGAGRAFCAGLDLQSSSRNQASGALGPVARMRGQETFAGMVTQFHALPQPTIAAVNGPAAGAGFALALAADVRLASRSAEFHVAAVKVGLSSGECGISYLLPRQLGYARAFEVMLTGRPIRAEEAERVGLVAGVVDDEALTDAALDAAAMIRANSPFGVATTKRLMWANLEATSLRAAIELENRAQVIAGMTEDSREAMTAFVEKRAPVFEGE